MYASFKARLLGRSVSSLTKGYSNSKFEPVLDTGYICDPGNKEEILHNINIRKGVGDIETVHRLLNELQKKSGNGREQREKLRSELLKIPNKTHVDIKDYGDEPKVMQYYNKQPTFDFKPSQFQEIAHKNRMFRMEHLSNCSGHKSYYLMGDLAQLEQCLIRYTIDRLQNSDFELIAVPDTLSANVIEGCGFSTRGERNQVYKLNQSDLCLSGTSEMSLAAYFSNRLLDSEQLPIKKVAISRCYRAETSGLQEEKGIYRVHQFNKVEMFTVARPDQSDLLLEEFKNIQIDIFNGLGLHFKLLDMPPHELGAPAYRKYDIETYMSGRKMWGEISSCSNCTDYQARRLNVQFKVGCEQVFVHTINGTACAVPRLLMAIVETYQNANGSINVPEALIPYMKKDRISIQQRIPSLKLIKSVFVIR